MKRDAIDFGAALQARASELTQTAHRLLILSMERHGNLISQRHELALWQLMSGLTDQGLHIRNGRCAYALPCGAGKTLSVVAWIAAQYRLGLGLSIAVSAQQIAALCDIKDGLIAEGVPESEIGICHSMGQLVKWPDTGKQDRPIMLGSQARVHAEGGVPGFCLFKGKARDLLIWDESLISSKVSLLELSLAETALSHFAKVAGRPMLNTVLAKLGFAITQERSAQDSDQGPTGLQVVTEVESEAALLELAMHHCRTLAEKELLKQARDLVSVLKHPVSLINVGSGATGMGLMRYQITVAPELSNIVVLDASFTVRALCKADPTIGDHTTDAMRNFKSYAKVLVKQSIVSSGRYQFANGKRDSNLALREAVQSIGRIPADESILVFTYKEKDDAILNMTRASLRDAGIDTEAVLACGRRRISFSTWGKHTTDNSFGDCQHVVLLGVLRMPLVTLAAAMAGQKDDLLYRMTRDELLSVEASELTSNIMQAANRGRCRKVTADGTALPMTIHLFTKEDYLRRLLQDAMPDLQWETLKTGKQSKVEDVANLIVDYMRSVPDSQTRISKQAIFTAIDVQLGKDAKADAMHVALLELTMHSLRLDDLRQRWTIRGRSLERLKMN